VSVGTRLRAALRIPPYKFQVRNVRHIEAAGGRGMILDEPGMGKTLCAAGWMAIHPEARPGLIICPAPIKEQWRRALRDLAGIRAQVLSGRAPRPIRAPVAIINYEVLHSWREALRAWGPRVVVIDEMHRIKSRRAKCTRAAGHVCGRAPHVIALSGTPIDNCPAEFFPTLKIVRPDLFQTWFEFAQRYCDPKRGWGGRFDYSGASNLGELRRRIAPFAIRNRKRDVLRELPAKQRIVVPVEIDNRRSYEHARDDFLAWTEEFEGRAAAMRAAGAVALTRMSRLLRLCAAGKLPAARAWMEDWLEESPGKLVVFAIHREVLDRLKEWFPDAAEVRGGVTGRRRQREVDRFCSSKRCRIMLANIRAGGVGLDGLQRVSSTTLTLELAWNEAAHRQAEDRVNRPGQRLPCDNYYLLGRDTIEEWLLGVLERKQVAVDEILEGREAAMSAASLLEMFSAAQKAGEL